LSLVTVPYRGGLITTFADEISGYEYKRAFASALVLPNILFLILSVTPFISF
jgi:hypothetical protein